MSLESVEILKRVRDLHAGAGFGDPPLDLQRVLRLRPDVTLSAGEEDAPLEVRGGSAGLALRVPACEDPLDLRFRIAHGLGHAMLHATPHRCEGAWPSGEISLEEPGAAAGILIERQAHLFALELLMPMALVEAITELRITLFMKGEEVDTEVERLARLFQAPPDAARARLHLLMSRHFRAFTGGPG